uniref:Large ribosomal subunit protein uL23c n=1 Tax=Bryopsis sp. HV04063 TaxID=1979421 RepID=A0A2P0QH58_9CHLO|nr:ribosomal protein L23 [Bryopsis sp. HV04063]ARO74105.1 ribosomal protein L23 [Bryopsis sp. HV04063]
MLIDYLKQPELLTEKTINRLENNQYTFDVVDNLTKSQIQQIFKKLYNITPLKINSHILSRKKTRLLASTGYKNRIKRIIIKLEKTQKLPIQTSFK